MRPGDQVEIRGGGFMPGEDFVVTMYSTPRVLGTFVADADGYLAASVTIPTDIEAGQHTIEAVAASSGHTLSIEVTVRR